MDKKVSVIIPCFNKGEYVKEAIESVINQTYKNIEIVCIDDCSTDNSYETLKELANKYENIILLRNEENKGVVYSRNTAIEKATGEYILPVDADDTIEPTYIEKAAKILDENPNIGIVYCKARMFGSINKHWDLPDFDKSNILYDNCIFCSALFRKSDFIKVGMYKDYMQYGYEDYDLWLSFIEQGFEVYRINEILFNYRQFKKDEHSRSKINLQNNNIWKTLIRNHMDTYLEDKQFWEKFHFKHEKYKKYRKLFNIFLILSIIEFIILVTIGGLI